MIKLGVNTVLFGKYDFPTAAKIIKKCGFDGLEISALGSMGAHLNLQNEAWKKDKDMIKSVMDGEGLEMLSCEVATTDEEVLKKALEAAVEVGIPILNIGTGGRSDGEGELEAAAERVQHLAEMFEGTGVFLGVKAHVGSAVYNTKTTLYLMEHVSSPAFGVDMDPSHLFRAFEEPENALASVLPRMKHIHIRDCGRPDPSKLGPVRVIVKDGKEIELPASYPPGIPPMQACGRGDINLMGYCKAMVDAGYDGPVCLECIGASTMAGPYTALDSAIIAAETYGYLNACLKHLGGR